MTKKYNSLKELSEEFSKKYEETFDRKLLLMMQNKCFRCGIKDGHTKECLKEQKSINKKNIEYEKKEKIRRAKKITITIGELEDLQDRYNYDD